MGGRCKREEPRESCDETAADVGGLSPGGETRTGLAEQHTPVPGLTGQDEGSGPKAHDSDWLDRMSVSHSAAGKLCTGGLQSPPLTLDPGSTCKTRRRGRTTQEKSSAGLSGPAGARCSIYGGDKVYLGVRVKMPVKDLLRKIRIAQGCKPQDFKDIRGKTVNGDKQRVKTRTGRRTTKRKLYTKSLEELAIIVEVLEEDLRTGNTCRSPPQSLSSSNPSVSPEWSPAVSEYNSDESDEMILSPQSYMTYSPGTAEYQQAMSPPGFMHTCLQPPSVENIGRVGGRGGEWGDHQEHDWNLNNSAFFWAQLQREESQLRDLSDAVLLASDGHGKTALHKVACVGKRALGYAIAKRMAALNSLDLKDSDGMTALLYAAKHNHHLMVADLILLGANVNDTNKSGKTCLHLSAEKGYIRVLEVLKHTMMDGVYVDVEATDNSGMSVLQCASVALKATVRKLECSKSPNHTRLHTLRQGQMMETLECLLQMGSYLHTMGSLSMQPRMGLTSGTSARQGFLETRQ